MSNKNIIVAILGVVACIAIWGAYLYPNDKYVSEDSTSANDGVAAGSTAGTSFSTSKFAGIAVNLAAPGTTGTTSSILNTDAFDRYVTAVKAGCQGVGTSKTAYTGTGLSTLQLTVGTSSTANPVNNTYFSSVGVNMVIPTSTANYAFASSTSAYNLSTSTNSLVWSSGSYMTFQTNATNTAVCTFGVDYFQS